MASLSEETAPRKPSDHGNATGDTNNYTLVFRPGLGADDHATRAVSDRVSLHRRVYRPSLELDLAGSFLYSGNRVPLV
jgi:hypothetical protein